ncbi:hypothetical protein QBC39DRAFT_391328 [Podospora conica]|nr:hypothetical protein QBC39DRAFT_391328 [Schizothecium conicum]
MEHPVKDVRHILRTLTQGSPSEQNDAITRYFTPSASLVQPMCRVPSFSDIHIRVPFSGGVDLDINSRTIILAIYKWYQILSPRTDIKIESTGTLLPSPLSPPSPKLTTQIEVFDQQAKLLYITAHHTLTPRFLPFLTPSPLRLVTILHLVPDTSSPPPSEALLTNGVSHTPSPITTPLGDAPTEPTFAEVASTAVDTSEVVDAATGKPERRLAQGRRYRIDRQEDLYQVGEFVRLVAMAPGAAVYGWWQLLCTWLCVLGVLVLGPVVRVAGKEGRRAAAAAAAGLSGGGQTVGGKRY